MQLIADYARQLLGPYKAIAFGYWGAEFELPEIVVTALGSDAGCCEGYGRICINSSLWTWPEEFRETTVHEYAHAVVAWLAEKFGGIAATDEYHGKVWKAVMATFGYPDAQPDHCLPLGDGKVLQQLLACAA